MKTFEDYKRALMDQPSPHLREQLMAQAEADGLDSWALGKLAEVADTAWA